METVRITVDGQTIRSYRTRTERMGFGRENLAPYDLSMAVVGTGLLWVGWFGFNGGSAYAAGSRAVWAIVTTHLSACAGAVAWTGLEWMHRGKPSVLGMISGAIAERIGLDYRNAPRAMTQTANGAVPVHRVSLGAVRVGEVEVANVEAIVVPARMSYVLLGNSFLGRFQMRRENDQLRLERRP